MVKIFSNGLCRIDLSRNQKILEEVKQERENKKLSKGYLLLHSVHVAFKSESKKAG